MAVRGLPCAGAAARKLVVLMECVCRMSRQPTSSRAHPRTGAAEIAGNRRVFVGDAERLAEPIPSRLHPAC